MKHICCNAQSMVNNIDNLSEGIVIKNTSTDDANRTLAWLTESLRKNGVVAPYASANDVWTCIYIIRNDHEDGTYTIDMACVWSSVIGTIDMTKMVKWAQAHDVNWRHNVQWLSEYCANLIVTDNPTITLGPNTSRAIKESTYIIV